MTTRARNNTYPAIRRIDPMTEQNTNEGATEFKPKAKPGPKPKVRASDMDDEQRLEASRKRREARRADIQNGGGFEGQKLTAPNRPGYYRRWINDDGNRLDDKVNDGYDYVLKSSDGAEKIHSTGRGEKISQLVGTKKEGGPMVAYLMEIPEELYLEDQEQKESKRRDTELQIKRAAHGNNSLGGGDGNSVMYNPRPGSNNLLE
jgi:hypothetical protein